MRAISLWQPWATLVAVEEKRFETRHWKTPFRGELAIHASKTFRSDCKRLAQTDRFSKALKRGCLKDSGLNEQEQEAIPFDEILLPLGGVVAVVELVEIIPVEVWLQRHCHRGLVMEKHVNEFAFGNYEPGRFAWKLENVRRLKSPVACPGRQGFWTLSPEIEQQVIAQL